MDSYGTPKPLSCARAGSRSGQGVLENLSCPQHRVNCLHHYVACSSLPRWQGEPSSDSHSMEPWLKVRQARTLYPCICSLRPSVKGMCTPGRLRQRSQASFWCNVSQAALKGSPRVGPPACGLSAFCENQFLQKEDRRRMQPSSGSQNWVTPTITVFCQVGWWNLPYQRWTR
jgi:hypothetical protein